MEPWEQPYSFTANQRFIWLQSYCVGIAVVKVRSQHPQGSWGGTRQKGGGNLARPLFGSETEPIDCLNKNCRQYVFTLYICQISCLILSPIVAQLNLHWPQSSRMVITYTEQYIESNWATSFFLSLLISLDSVYSLSLQIHLEIQYFSSFGISSPVRQLGLKVKVSQGMTFDYVKVQ